MFPGTSFHRGLHSQNSVTIHGSLIRSCFHTYKIRDSSLSLRCNLVISSWSCCGPGEHTECLEKNTPSIYRNSCSLWCNTSGHTQLYFNPQYSLQESKRPNFPCCPSLPNCSLFGPDNRKAERKADLTGQTSKPDSQQLKLLSSVNLICT